MDKQILVEPAEKNKRLLSILVDLVMLVAASFALYFLSFYLVLSPITNYKEKENRYNEIREQYQITYSSGKEYTVYQDVLYKFYTEYYPEEIEAKLKEYFPEESYESSVHMYNVFILNLETHPRVSDGSYRSEYFQYQLDEVGNCLLNERGVLRNDRTSEAILKKVSQNMYNKYVELEGVLKTYNTEYRSIVNDINNAKLISRAIAVGLSVTIFAVIVPLCLKNGRTLGNKFFEIVIVNYKDGFKIKNYKVLIRALAQYGLPIVGVLVANHYAIISLVVFPLFISTILILFTNRECDLADFFSSTAAVDKRSSLVFGSAGEASLYHKKEENQVVEDPEYLEKLSSAEPLNLSTPDTKVTKKEDK